MMIYSRHLLLALSHVTISRWKARKVKISFELGFFQLNYIDNPKLWVLASDVCLSFEDAK